MKAIAILLAALAMAQPAQAQRAQPIIDMHMHAFGFDEYGTPAPPNEITGKAPTAQSNDEAMRAAFAEMERHGVVLAVASGPLSHVLRWQKANPNKIVGGAYTGPRDALPGASELRRLFKAKSLGVLGELGLQYRGLKPSDESLRPYFTLAEQLDVPVALHTGLGDSGTPYSCCPKFRVSLGNPSLVEELLIQHPKLRVSLMHAGYPYLQETKALLYVYPQVYVDIAVVNWALPREEFHSYLRSLIDAGFGKRIMYGSDQMIWPDMIGTSIKNVESAAFLTAEQKQDIFYNNAARFLRLDDATIAKHHGR